MPIKKVTQNPLTIFQPSLSDTIKRQEAFCVTRLPILKPVVLSDLVRILTGVFLSGGPEGEYDNEPNGPQLTKATYIICDVGYHTGPRSYGGQLCVGCVK